MLLAEFRVDTARFEWLLLIAGAILTLSLLFTVIYVLTRKEKGADEDR
jgi:hypothetical protein